MGFGREAKRVRDSSLPRRYRVHALGSCIQISQPIGFNATWSYLEAKVGRSWRAPDFLLPALDQLEDVRRRHAVLQAEYADWRHAQRVSGFASRPAPSPPQAHRDAGTVTSGSEQRMPSGPGEGSAGTRHCPRTHGVAGYSRRSTVASPPSAVPSAVDRAELQRCLTWAQRQIYVVGWERDPVEYRLASTTHYLLGQLHLLLFGEPRLGAKWHFEAG